MLSVRTRRGVAWIVTSIFAAAPAALGQIPPVPTTDDPATGPQPQLFAAERIYELGVLIEGDKATATWLLENHGDADLVIERTRAGCGCTVVKLAEEDHVIPAGGKLELVAEFDSRGRRGSQRKTVIVVSNDPAEPNFKLELTAEIEPLYEIRPSSAMELRMLRRGDTGDRPLELTPAVGRDKLDVVGIDIPPGIPLTYRLEPFQAPRGQGQRVLFTVSDQAALGPINATLVVHLRVDDVEREREVRVRGLVVADLVWQPRVVDATRLKSKRGKRLAPVMLQSADKAPFDILDATAGPVLDVEFHPVKRALPRTRYEFLLTIRDDAPSGPFGASLTVRTSSIDQPVLEIPVFGIVAPRVLVDPPLILLRQDGTPMGTQRRLKTQASPQETLGIVAISCTNPAVTAVLDHEANARYHHLRYFDVRLTDTLPPGRYEATLAIETTIEGAEHLEIPVIIEAP